MGLHGSGNKTTITDLNRSTENQKLEMLIPEQGKTWPQEAFDYPKNHESYPTGDLAIVGLMLSTYMAGHPHKPP